MNMTREHPSGHTAHRSLSDGVWSVDAARSQVGFAVKDMWGLRTVRGVFRVSDGSLEVRQGRAVGRLTVSGASLDTGNRRRDDHLRSRAFFDVEQHPEILFAGTADAAPDGRLTVTGELTIGASGVALEIPVDVEQIDPDTVRLDGEATVSREAAGLAWNVLGMIRGDAMLHARLTLIGRPRDATE